MRNPKFLPMTKAEMEERGWSELDFLLVSGDAYVDHPSFGIAIISRILEKQNFRVGIIAQPDWRQLSSFTVLGKPKLACLISGGNLDSMVNHYTASKKRRSRDAYSPGGEAGLRPDRATIVYANRMREAMPGVPLIIGGIEASLRRFAHYDYWSNDVRRSILLDSQADMLVFGMAEKTIIELGNRLAAGEELSEIHDVRGTMIPWQKEFGLPEGTSDLPGFADVVKDKRKYAEAFWEQYNQQDAYRGKSMFQSHGQKGVLQNKPSFPLSQAEMDAVYALPYVGTYHPRYEEAGGVPAIEEVEFSIASSRGCYGACSFCALTFHQGRIIQSRSAESIVREAELMTWNPRFKGYIHDVGGPTANFRRPACSAQLKRGACSHRQCLFPGPCDQIELDHEEYINLLRRLRKLPRVKKVFVRSGIRYDAVLADKQSDFLSELCEHHVSGQLKVAPEHVSNTVLQHMGKPQKQVYEKFVKRFKETNERLGKKQFLVPYLMSSHPGSGLKEAIELAEYVRDMGVNPEQVQDFIPTPGTLSTCMYYTGLDPKTMESIYVPRSMHEKAMQRALIQYRNPKNYELVKEALKLAHREDLIGYGPKCLIKPRKFENTKSKGSNKKESPKNKTRKAFKSSSRTKLSITKETDKSNTGIQAKTTKPNQEISSKNAGREKIERFDIKSSDRAAEKRKRSPNSKNMNNTNSAKNSSPKVKSKK